MWSDTFVTDWSLSHAVSELRTALEDDATNPRYIQTLPKRGYRLIARVESVEESAVHFTGRKQPEVTLVISHQFSHREGETFFSARAPEV